jgi:hypothetical protein
MGSMNFTYLHVFLDSNGGASGPLFELGNSLDDSCFVGHVGNVFDDLFGYSK